MKSNDDIPFKLGAVVLAGGKSSRMRFPKPWLQYDDNQLFLERIVEVYSNLGVSEIVVVLNKEFAADKWREILGRIKEKAVVVENNSPEKGRLYSLSLGLKAMDMDFTIIHNVDNPFVEESVISELIDNFQEGKAVVPTYNGRGGHPIIIDSEIQSEIKYRFDNYYDLRSILKKYSIKKIETGCASVLANLNTPEEYQEAMHEHI
jgi:molybdenum cofactor cytidylyltransferase